MNFSSSHKISRNAVVPVAESPDLPANLTPGFYAAYEAIQKEEAGSREKNQQETADSGKDEPADPDSKQMGPSGIFCLLKKYRFKDFLRLSLSEDDSTLMMVIKKERKSRGINGANAVSHNYRENEEFMDRMEHRYERANWLMTANPGQSYSGIL